MRESLAPAIPPTGTLSSNARVERSKTATTGVPMRSSGCDHVKVPSLKHPELQQNPHAEPSYVFSSCCVEPHLMQKTRDITMTFACLCLRRTTAGAFLQSRLAPNHRFRWWQASPSGDEEQVIMCPLLPAGVPTTGLGTQLASASEDFPLTRNTSSFRSGMWSSRIVFLLAVEIVVHHKTKSGFFSAARSHLACAAGFWECHRDVLDPFSY